MLEGMGMIDARMASRSVPVKKKVQMSRGADFSGLCAPLLARECGRGAEMKRRASRSSGRRRSARAAAEQASIRAVPIATVLVGANVLMREGLARILSAADFSVSVSTCYADDHVLGRLEQEQPILLVIDVGDDFNGGLRQIESFKRRHPGGRVVVLADQYELTEIELAFRMGANAYLTKIATCETFVKSLELVMLGVTFLPPEILNSSRRAVDDVGGGEDIEIGADVGANRCTALAGSACGPRLSARQDSILRCLVQGDSNKTIARKMGMAEATVKVHVKAILRKIRVHNRTQAAIWAMSNGSFVPANAGVSALLEEPPAKAFPNLNIAPVSTAGHTNGAASLSTLELKGAGRVAMPHSLRLVRKNG
jgi:two-component system nitrate/nitrite response regulator NarL